MKEEMISAFADGELSGEKAQEVLGALTQAERETWATYHLIGDVMRTEDLSLGLSEGFSSRMAARLAEEPVLSPLPGNARASVSPAPVPQAFLHHLFSTKIDVRRLIPGVAAISAVTAAGIFAVPHLMVANNTPRNSRVTESAQLAAVSKQGVVPASMSSASSAPVLLMPAATAAKRAAASDQHAALDSYLIAHQHFSPAVQASAQYVRSSIFAAEVEK